MHRLLLGIAIAASACGHGAGATSGACAGLDLHDCRLEPDCAPDLCDGCGCATTYRGCLAAGAVPTMCPALGCASGICCSAAQACASSSGSCTTPGTTLGCGACNTEPNACTTDADCKPGGATQICEPIQCSCDGANACTTGCVDDSTCSEGTACDLSRARCVALACSAAAPCPANFDCASGACARTTCATDEDCDGYCVEGACYSERGSCQLPVP